MLIFGMRLPRSPGQIAADKKKKGKNKTHVVFDGGRVFRVKRLTGLEDAAEVYIDAVFP